LSRRGIDIADSEVHVGRDLVGGDVITVQRTGFSAQEVRRLLIAVGALVFVTAACFFVLGATVSVAVIIALNRPLSTPANRNAAAQMQQKINALNSLQPGQGFIVSFSEHEVSSYFEFVIGPALSISKGKARLLDEPGQIAIGGKLNRLGGVDFAAQLDLTTRTQPIVIRGAWIKILPTQDTPFGWVPVTPFAQSLEQQLNALLFEKVRFTGFNQTGSAGPDVGPRQLTLRGIAQ